MAKFHGIIGYAKSIETRPGVYMDEITERTYNGDVTQNIGNWSTSSDSTNDDLNVNNQISIIADSYAYQNSDNMKYITFMGAKWKIKSIRVAYPRLILTVGGVYNGK